jgi:hypothetical protein
MPTSKGRQTVNSIVRKVTVVGALAAALLVPAGTAMAATTSSSTPSPAVPATLHSVSQVRPADCATDGYDLFVLVAEYSYPSGTTYWYEDEYDNFYAFYIYEGPYFFEPCGTA